MIFPKARFRRTLRSTRSSPQRGANPIGKANFWAQHRDILLLLAGAVIGALSAFITVSQQGRFQRDQAIFEKKYSTIQELAELTNEAWRNFENYFDELQGLLNKILEEVEKVSDDQSMKEFLLRLKPHFLERAESIMQKGVGNTGQYVARVEALLGIAVTK